MPTPANDARPPRARSLVRDRRSLAPRARTMLAACAALASFAALPRASIAAGSPCPSGPASPSRPSAPASAPASAWASASAPAAAETTLAPRPDLEGDDALLLGGDGAREILDREIEALRTDLRGVGTPPAARFIARHGEVLSGVLRAQEVVFPADATVFVDGSLVVRAAGSVTLASRLVFLRPRDGGAQAALLAGSGNGANGASISIKAGGDVTVDADLVAEDGGNGADADAAPTSASRSAEAHAGAGGSGGGVTVSSGGVLTIGATIHPGSGGAGGASTVTGSAGAGCRSIGGYAYARGGPGGAAGLVSLTARRLVVPDVEGTPAGRIVLASGGAGGAALATGGAGGDCATCDRDGGFGGAAYAVGGRGGSSARLRIVTPKLDLSGHRLDEVVMAGIAGEGGSATSGGGRGGHGGACGGDASCPSRGGHGGAGGVGGDASADGGQGARGWLLDAQSAGFPESLGNVGASAGAGGDVVATGGPGGGGGRGGDGRTPGAGGAGGHSGFTLAKGGGGGDLPRGLATGAVPGEGGSATVTGGVGGAGGTGGDCCGNPGGAGGPGGKPGSLDGQDAVPGLGGDSAFHGPTPDGFELETPGLPAIEGPRGAFCPGRTGGPDGALALDVTAFVVDPFFPFDLSVSACATITNVGDATLPPTQVLLGQSTSDVASYQPAIAIPAIEPGLSMRVCTPYARRSGSGRTTYLAILDPEDHVRELSERNNRAAVTVAF